MPKLIRLYIQSVLIGFGLSAAFAALLVWRDIGGLGRLILGSDQGYIALAMLVICNGVIFSGVQFALRVMAMAEGDGAKGGGLRARVMEVLARGLPMAQPIRRPVKVPVVAKAPRRHPRPRG